MTVGERALVLREREEWQIHVQDDAEEYGNPADDRHQLEQDEGEQRAQSDCRFFPTVPHEEPLSTEIQSWSNKAHLR